MGFFDKCYGCEKRYPACQDTCPTGIEQKQKYEAKKKKIDEARAKDYESKGYIKAHYESQKSLRRKYDRNS